MAAISCFKAEFTSRCLASMFLDSKCGETIMAWKACPQPPDVEETHTRAIR